MDLMTTGLSVFLFLLSTLFLYYSATKGIPSRLQGDQAPKSKFGLVPVEGFVSGSRIDPTGVDIIFVHGLGSNPDTTWQARKRSIELGSDRERGVCWVTDYLPEDLSAIVGQGVRLFFYNHDSFWKQDAVQTRLSDLSNALLNRISSTIKTTNEERSRGLVFVAHSYGGLIVKEALVQASKNESFAVIAENTKAALFLGTPHRGSNFSRWGSLIAWALRPLGSSPSILDELAYDSVSLLDLHKKFVAVTGKSLRVVNFFEQRPVQIVAWRQFRWNKVCVPEQSGTYESPQVQNIGLGVDHYGLNKFESRDHNYEIILQKLGETAKPYISDTKHCSYSVPLGTVNCYTERHELSTAIEKKLHQTHENSDLSHTLVIHGLGGSGKTQLALKYAEDHKNEYNPILWIDGKDEGTVRSSFERCASELRLSVDRGSAPGVDLADSATVLAVLRWLRDRKESDDPWLVVVDNTDDVTWGIKKIIPKGQRGSVIITSQDSQSSGLLNGSCEKISVNTMEPLEATKLLLRHLELDLNTAGQDIQHICSNIALQLGYLALAVDLAGAYIGNDYDPRVPRVPRVALERYLINYSRHQELLLQNDDFRGLSPTDKTVWTVWDATLERIKSRNLNLRPDLLLKFLAHFNTGIVQTELFRLASLGFWDVKEKLFPRGQEFPDWLDQLVKLNGEEWDDFHYESAIKPLVRFSLLQRVNGEWPGTTMHGLVQWRAIKYEKDQPCDFWYFMFVLAASYRTSQEEARPQFRRYMITHMPDIRESCLDDMRFDDEKKIFIWKTVSEVCYDEGRWKEAEELQVQVMKTRKRVLGEEHPDTLTSKANLASTYWKQGRWTEAEKLFMQVMKIKKKVLGEEHPDTITIKANLASTYRNQGRWTEAEKLEIQVMEIRKKVLGEEHLGTLTIMGNLASTYSNQGRWTEAEKLEVQVMKTRKRVLGEEHLDTLTSKANLASTYWKQGRWTEAEKLFMQVMKIKKRVLGEEHPDTVTIKANLASTYRNQGRWTEAEKLEVQVMKTRKRVLGEEHPDTLTIKANLASTYRNQGRWTEAEKLEMQVMEIRKKVLGEEHPGTLAIMANLASTYSNQGRWTEAEKLFMQVIKIKKRVLGEEHPDTITIKANLASTYRNQGRWTEAEKLEMQVMEIRKKVLGEEHPGTLTIMANLASTYSNQGRWTEAEKLEVQVMKTRKRVLGEEHPDTLTSKANLASTYWEQGRWTEAEKLFMQVMEIRKRVLGERHPRTLISMNNLAHTYKLMDRHDEAMELINIVIDLYTKEIGANHPYTLSAVDSLSAWSHT